MELPQSNTLLSVCSYTRTELLPLRTKTSLLSLSTVDRLKDLNIGYHLPRRHRSSRGVKRKKQNLHSFIVASFNAQSVKLIICDLASGIFPQCFKSALVTPIFKKRCLYHNDLNNYRPVSNLCFIAKILEKLVLSQVSYYLNSHNLYNTCQSAYRPGHSTETALLKVVNDLFLSLNKGNIY